MPTRPLQLGDPATLTGAPSTAGQVLTTYLVPGRARLVIERIDYYAHPDLYHLLTYEVRDNDRVQLGGLYPAPSALDRLGLVLPELHRLDLVVVPRSAADQAAIDAVLAVADYAHQTLTLTAYGHLEEVAD